MNSRDKGFTVVEVLLAVTLIAVFAVAVSYRLYSNLDSVVLRSASGRLLQTARYGRLLAAQYHLRCKLYIDLTNRSYWLIAEPTGVPVTANAGQEDVSAEKVVNDLCPGKYILPDSLQFAVVQVGKKRAVATGHVAVTFEIDGRADAAIIQICNDKETHTLQIEAVTSKAVLRNGAINELYQETIAVP